MDFSPSFYEQLEDRLNLAVFDINESYRMRWDLATIRAGLGDIPESNTLAIRNDQDQQFLTYNARTLRIDEFNTIDEIRHRLNLDKIDQAIAVHKEITGRQPMSSMIERLKAKALAARNIAPDAMKAFEADLDGLSAEKAVLDAQRAAAIAPHQEAIAEIKSELDGLKSAIDILSNDPPA